MWRDEREIELKRASEGGGGGGGGGAQGGAKWLSIVYATTCCSMCYRVRNWALKFGVDLWEFGRQATKLGEIQRASFNIILYKL